jgi:integrase
LQIEYNINLKNFQNLTIFLKQLSQTYKKKQASVLTEQDVTIFLKASNQGKFLVDKLLQIAFYGALRVGELTTLQWDDVQETQDGLLVTIRQCKTDQCGKGYSFLVLFHQNSTVCPVHVFRLYKEQVMKLYDSSLFQKPPGRLFRNFNQHSQQFTKTPMGHNMISQAPQRIAAFLGKPDSKKYTGHCFRRSSATVLADQGISLPNLMRHGRWKSTLVAQSYIDESHKFKKEVASLLTNATNVHINNDNSNNSQTFSLSNTPITLNFINCNITNCFK